MTRLVSWQPKSVTNTESWAVKSTSVDAYLTQEDGGLILLEGGGALLAVMTSSLGWSWQENTKPFDSFYGYLLNSTGGDILTRGDGGRLLFRKRSHSTWVSESV